MEDLTAGQVATRRGGAKGKRRSPRQTVCRRHNAIARQRDAIMQERSSCQASCGRHPTGPRRVERAARRRHGGV